METAAFQKGATLAEKQARQLGQRLQSIGDGMASLGKKMALGITAPLLGLGVVGVKMAADFESAMTKVGISSQASAKQMKQMSELALDIGKATTFGASEAAEAMDMLAKTGLSAEQILGGAARAVTNLAAAAGSELEPAASAISDAMQQFGLKTKDLPMVVNQITGAVNESKLSFEDFTGAAAQAGGIAGNLGVSFQDFNAAIAATSPLFQSGSDAGTSFKTFLQRLKPATDKAAAAMKALGLNFYDSNGSMKDMSEIAELLRLKLSGLSEERRTEALSTMFGSDAMRTAIGLMKVGAKGIDEISAKIGKTDAAAQAAKQMTGLNAQMDQMKGALETLAIRIGQSGILEMLTGFIRKVTEFVDKLATASPGALKFAIAVASISAALGPALMIFGPAVNALGKLAPLLVKIGPAITGGGSAAGVGAIGFRALGTALVPLAGLALGALIIFEKWDSIAGMVERVTARLKALGTEADTLKSRVEANNKAFADFSSQKAFEASFGQALENFLVDTGRLLKGADDDLHKWQKGINEADAAIAKFAHNAWIGFDQILHSIQKWVNGADTAIATFARNGWTSFEQFHARAQAAFDRLVAGISSAVNNGLKTALDTAKGLVEGAARPFEWLYDVVVGHSYIPDMVDQIGVHMRRLDGEMVQPAKIATEKTANLVRDLQALLARLYPEAAANNQFLTDLAALDASLKAGKISADQYADALARLKTEGMESMFDGGMSKYLTGNVWDGAQAPAGAQDPTQALGDLLNKLPKVETKVRQSTGQIALSFANMAENIAGSLQNMAAAFKGGGFWDKVLGVLGVVQAGVQSYAGLKGGNFANRANGGSVIAGRSYMVGERGKEMFRPHASGRIIPNNDNGGSIAQIVPSPYFDVVVDGRVVKRAAPMVALGAAMGSAMAQQDIGRRQRARLP